MAEMEEGSHQASNEETQRQRAAERIEADRLGRQQAESGIGLGGEQGEEQPLADADECRKKYH